MTASPRDRIGSVTPLPPEFLEALAGQEEILVSSREQRQRGTVPVWFLVAPPGVVYLFTLGYSTKARRWKSDPWVRLTVPGTRISTEGMAHFVGAGDIDAVGPLVVEKWGTEGATTIEGLSRGIRDGEYALIRVEGIPAASR